MTENEENEEYDESKEEFKYEEDDLTKRYLGIQKKKFEEKEKIKYMICSSDTLNLHKIKVIRNKAYKIEIEKRKLSTEMEEEDVLYDFNIVNEEAYRALIETESDYQKDFEDLDMEMKEMDVFEGDEMEKMDLLQEEKEADLKMVDELVGEDEDEDELGIIDSMDEIIYDQDLVRDDDMDDEERRFGEDEEEPDIFKKISSVEKKSSEKKKSTTKILESKKKIKSLGVEEESSSFILEEIPLRKLSSISFGPIQILRVKPPCFPRPKQKKICPIKKKYKKIKKPREIDSKLFIPCPEPCKEDQTRYFFVPKRSTKYPYRKFRIEPKRRESTLSYIDFDKQPKTHPSGLPFADFCIKYRHLVTKMVCGPEALAALQELECFLQCDDLYRCIYKLPIPFHPSGLSFAQYKTII